VALKDGRTLAKDAHGARGYPSNPASADELTAKFLACAKVALAAPRAAALETLLRNLDAIPSLAGISE
jgi:hypothetical protein